MGSAFSFGRHSCESAMVISPPLQREQTGGAEEKNMPTHVHVHPDVVFLADVRYGDERIKGSVNGGAGRGAHEERDEALEGHKIFTGDTLLPG